MSRPSQECVAVLQEMWRECEDTLRMAQGLSASQPIRARIEALTAAIDALQRQGEAVAYRWSRNGEPQGCWIDGKPSDRQFQAAKDCTEMATWTVEYAYALPPQPPTGEQK